MGVPLGFGTAWCGVYEGTLPGSEAPIYLLEHDALFGAPRIYGGEGGTLEGGVKFGLLSRAAFELSRYLAWQPNVLHVHDWPSGWVPVLLNGPEARPPWLEVASVLTIHNMAHQPKFPPVTLEHLGIPWSEFRPDALEDFGDVNPFKGGLYHATMITTVSPRYAHEIRAPALGAGLDHVAELRGADLVGILNGIDEEVWDPARDPLLPATYDVTDLSGKAVCKAELQRRFGLAEEPHTPLIGLVSRLSWQKGLDVVAASLDRLLGLGAQVVLLGSGDAGLEGVFRYLAELHPGRFGVWIGYSEPIAHLVEAGSDFFLMPSRFEPCGLNQLYSQRYGTLPIVHATGGLEDTVEQCNVGERRGTGFKMYALHVDALTHTVSWALDVYRNAPDLYRAMQEQSMRKRMGWDEAAARYVDVYRWAGQRKGVQLS
jgi:starch synthase